MPRRKRGRSTFRKRTFRKRRFVRRRRTVRRRRVTMDVNPMRGVTVRHSYNQVVSLDPGAGLIAVSEFLVAGAFDPSVTISGHKVFGFEQMALRYEHYRVIRSTITVTPVQSSSANTTPGVYGLAMTHLSGQVITTTQVRALMEGEAGRTAWKATGMADMVEANPRKAAISRSWSGRRQSGSNYVPADHVSERTSNPAFPDVYVIWYGAPNDISDPGIRDFMVRMTMTTRWSNPLRVLADTAA